MRLSFRLSLSLIAGVAVTSVAFALYQTILETRSMREDAAHHAVILAESLEKPVSESVARNSVADLQGVLDRFPSNTGIAGIAVYDASGSLVAVTSRFTSRLPADLRPVHDALADGVTHREFRHIDDRSIHVLASPLQNGDRVVGVLVVFDDVTYLDAQTSKSPLGSSTIEEEWLCSVTIANVNFGPGVGV